MLASEYVGARAQALYKCTKCRFEWHYMPTNLLRDPRCPSCNPKWNSRVSTVTYRGHDFKIRSIGEREVLKLLLKKYGSKDVACDLTHGTPTVHLKGGKVHRPDFYVYSTNTLIEVKSVFTLGLGYKTGKTILKGAYKSCISKLKAAREQGYKYKMFVVNGTVGTYIKLPSRWYEIPPSDLQPYVMDSKRCLQLSSLPL